MSIAVTEIDSGILAPTLRYVILKCVDSGAGSADEVATGLSRIKLATPHTKNDANTPKINETFPLESGNLTCTADATSDEFYLWVVGE